MPSKLKRDKLTRSWWFILYPESAPSDWLDLLRARMIPFAVSPLHDKDIDDDGSTKKPHYHVMLRFDGPTTYNHVLEITRQLKQPIPIVYDSFSGAFAYLNHLNDPDKYQYKDAPQLYNGFKPPRLSNDIGGPSMKGKIISFARDNNITEYSQLVEALLDAQLDDWFEEVINHSYAYVQYLRSAHFMSVQRVDKILSLLPPVDRVSSDCSDNEQFTLYKGCDVTVAEVFGS